MPFRTVHARTLVRLVALVALCVICPDLVVRAQTTGGDAPPPRQATSARPVLVDIEFEGNNDNDLNDKVLKAQIRSKGTERPALRVFSIFARVYDLPFMPARMRDEMHEIVDSLSGEERYFNPRFLREDTIALRTVYEHFGYSEVQIDYRILIDTARNRSKIRFFIEEGPRYKNRGITYVGVEEVPEDVLEQFREPEAFEVGDDYRSSEIVAETGRAVSTLQNNGYPFAIRTGAISLKHHDTVTGERWDSALVSIYTGGRYRFGETDYRPDDESEGPELKEWVVLRQIEYNPGEWYSRQKVDQTLSNLYGLGVFEYVRLDSLTSATSGDVLGMQLVTKLSDPRTLLLTPDISFERYVREYYAFVGASATFTHANFFGGAEKLTLQARARLPYSALNDPSLREMLLTYGGSISYVDQTLLGRRQSLGFSAGYDHSIEDRIFEEIRLGDGSSGETATALLSDRFFGSVEWTVRPPAHTYVSSITTRLSPQNLRYSNVGQYIEKRAQIRVDDAINKRTLASDDRDLAIAQVRRAMVDGIFREQVWLGDSIDLVSNPHVRENFNALKTSFVASGVISADHRDDFFSPRNGDLFDGRLELGTNMFVNQWIKAEAEYRRFWPWGDDKAVGGRAHVGAIVPIGPIKLVPLTSRFWAGGANSLRGWGPREMLVTESTAGGDTGVAREIVAEVLRDGRRLLGGLLVLEVMADWRWRPFRFPATSTLIQQVNQLMMVVGLDVGGAFFRDYEDEKAQLRDLLHGIGVSPSLAFGYDTPIGPIRVGFGYAVRDPIRYDDDNEWVWERPFTIGDFSWFFSIGHAF